MSTIRILDGTTHIVRYGMQDYEAGEFWVLFWRNGVGFMIHVERGDIKDTPFSVAWLENLKESSMESPDDWVKRWENLCDCVIGQAMPLLKELAPSGEHWTTLQDYINTTSYTLKMVTDAETKEAKAIITKGPKCKPAYETWPTAAANMNELPSGLQSYHASDLVVLEKEKDWRAAPHKVQTADGKVFVFRACEKTGKYMPDDTIENESLAVINAYSRLYGKLPEQVHLPLLEGFVRTEQNPDIDDSSPGVDWKDDPRARHDEQVKHDTGLIAGILLTYIPGLRMLREVLKDDQRKPTAAQLAKWRDQIRETVDSLHRAHVTIGGRPARDEAGSATRTGLFLNDASVMIQEVQASQQHGAGGVGEAWLNLVGLCTCHDLEGGDVAETQEKFEAEKEMDMQAIAELFGGDLKQP